MKNKNSIQTIDKLQLIVKVSERCNLSCSYCYYFNGEVQDHNKKPPIIRSNVADKVIDDLKKFIQSGNKVRLLEVILHGGEPLLLKLDRMEQLLQSFIDNLSGLTTLRFGMQTNGTIVTEKVIELINKFGIGVGVSIDGVGKHHDKHRIYTSGRGSFDDVVSGIKKLKNGIDTTKAPELGIISVATNASEMVNTYNFVTQDLGVNSISFLYPDRTHDQLTGDAKLNGELHTGLIDCFMAWSKQPNVYFKNVCDYLDVLQEKDTSGACINYVTEDSIASGNYSPLKMVIIRSDGELYFYDRFLPETAEKTLGHESNYSVLSGSLIGYLNSDVYRAMHDAYTSPNHDCSQCRYRTVCTGGELQHRYSISNGFDNKSVYCSQITKFYDAINHELSNAGLDMATIDRKLTERLVI
ncbi:radical SAM protein [Vibrio alginolyticus]|uniref:radical SAM protein n=1 Tax=Vibrio alginolyticus TaxID=663 RepID=UPI003D7EAC50